LNFDPRHRLTPRKQPTLAMGIPQPLLLGTNEVIGYPCTVFKRSWLHIMVIAVDRPLLKSPRRC